MTNSILEFFNKLPLYATLRLIWNIKLIQQALQVEVEQKKDFKNPTNLSIPSITNL